MKSSKITDPWSAVVRQEQEAAQIAALSCEVTLNSIRKGIKNAVSFAVFEYAYIMLQYSNVDRHDYLDCYYERETEITVSIHSRAKTRCTHHESRTKSQDEGMCSYVSVCPEI
jgi:hypothetical protein